MNNKQLAEMIKTLRKKNLEEQNPKIETSAYLKKQKFKPEHVPDNGNTSPNDYVHRMAEARTPIISGGAQGQSTLGGAGMQNRAQGQKNRGQQNIVGRSLSEVDSIDLGPTETGKKSKEEKEDVTVNPPDTTFSTTDPTNKNANTREIKEKKNATMG